MKPKLNHLWITLTISAVLSLITIIATFIFDNWSPRYIYNIFFFTFFNFTILMLNTTLFTKYPKFLKAKVRKFMRISFAVGYIVLYLAATGTFLATGQMIRTQTLLFLSGMNNILTTSIITASVFIVFTLIILVFYDKISAPELEVSDRKLMKIIVMVSGALLILTILINMTYLTINEDLIMDTDALINYQSEDIVLQSLFSKNVSFDKPNVVFVLLEALSAESIGAYGYERNVTPNIDRLAEQSIVFTRAYTTSTHSDYAQPGLLSSRYMYNDQYHNMPIEDNPRKFLWDIFKEDNYTTGYYSSQDDRWQGMNFYLNYESLDNVSYSMTDGETDYGTGLARKDYDHKTADLVVEWLNETSQKEEPFFLYVNFQATHLPRSYPEEYAYYTPDKLPSKIFMTEGDVQNRYDNSLRYVDIQVGKILDFLEENNMTNNTIVALTADHGEDLKGRHGVTNHGKSIYEEELIVPAMIRIPGLDHEVVDDRVSHIDVVPTLIQMLDYPISKEFQGDIMRKNRPVFFVTQSHKHIIGMIYNDIKVILDLNRKLSEVYDLENDPEEFYSLNSKDYPDEMLMLLLWSHCQRDYYDSDKWDAYSEDRCTRNNNFKM